MKRAAALLLLLLPLAATAFVTPSRKTKVQSPSSSTVVQQPRPPVLSRPLSSRLQSSSNDDDDDDESTPTTSRRKRRNAGLDPEMRSKLLSESIAPWRTVRLFLYASAGSGALIGGLITLSGVAAALSGARTDIDLDTEYVNLLIDFGAVVAFALFFKLDIDKAAELNENVAKKLASKKDSKKVAAAMKEREQTLANLKINVRVSDDGKDMKEATIKDVQGGAKQHMIIVAGERGAIRDALFAANLLQMDFAVRDVLIVPYELATDTEKAMRPSGGFGQRPTWESAPYVADPTGDLEGWSEYINEELSDAIEQNGESVKKDGIAIVVKNTGSVIRRGVGKVPWRDMVEELEDKKKDDVEMADLRFLTPDS
mmetsp:Transcript_29395/g.59598  ORF Transcript_29395/g.59598 Transcript_29395/m.59598 type:complete len:370 (-) Transcript_29395:2406-3515(-)